MGRYGRWVSEMRGQRSQASVERAIGKSRGYLCRVEAGAVLPSRAVVNDIDAALGVSGGWTLCAADLAEREGVDSIGGPTIHRFRFVVTIDVPEGGYTFTPAGLVRCEGGRLIGAGGVDVTPGVEE